MTTVSVAEIRSDHGSCILVSLNDYESSTLLLLYISVLKRDPRTEVEKEDGQRKTKFILNAHLRITYRGKI